MVGAFRDQDCSDLLKPSLFVVVVPIEADLRPLTAVLVTSVSRRARKVRIIASHPEKTNEVPVPRPSGQAVRLSETAHRSILLQVGRNPIQKAGQRPPSPSPALGRGGANFTDSVPLHAAEVAIITFPSGR
jgi:hypothetical protein